MARFNLLPDIRARTVPVLALGCAVMVGNIYICQPLLALMADSLGVQEHTAALVAVAAQVGYGVGILFVVPLADVADPPRLVRRLLGLTCLALIAASASRGVPMLVLASVAIATATVVPQVLMPLAPALAAPEYRGRVVGSLSIGIVLGILLSRTLSGAIAQATGSWRAPYAFAAVLTGVLFFVLPPFVPTRRAATVRRSYAALLRSLPPLLKHQALLLSTGINLFAFAAFTAVWATLAFHLRGAPFHLGPAAAGLFGLWGAPGALLAPLAGRLCDRYGSSLVNAMGLASIAIALAIAGTAGIHSLLALVCAVNFLDFGIQSGQVANQTRIFGLGDEFRARLNTLYMSISFSGGAVGALAGGTVWSHAGWRGVCGLGEFLIGCAAVVLGTSLLRRRRVIGRRADSG